MCRQRGNILQLVISCQELFSLGVRSKCNYYEMYFSDYQSFYYSLDHQHVHQIITSAFSYLSSILIQSLLSTGTAISTTINMSDLVHGTTTPMRMLLFLSILTHPIFHDWFYCSTMLVFWILLLGSNPHLFARHQSTAESLLFVSSRDTITMTVTSPSHEILLDYAKSCCFACVWL